MENLNICIIFTFLVPFIAIAQQAKEEKFKNLIIDFDDENKNDVENQKSIENSIQNPDNSSATPEKQLKKELNGMMTIYAQFNFQDLPPDSLEPMPTLTKFFPDLAAMLPIKQPGSREKRAPATPAPGAGQSGFMGFLMQAMCAQQAAPNNIFNPMMTNPMMNPMGPLMNAWRGKRRATTSVRNSYSNRAMLNSQRLLMSRMMMSRRRRPTTPAPMMAQLNAAERNAMMMNQMLPFLLMQQQQPASQGTNQAVGVNPAAPGAQAAPGGGAAGGGGGGGLDLNSLVSQALCMQASMGGGAPLHPPEPGTAAAAGGGMGGMGGMGMGGLFGMMGR